MDHLMVIVVFLHFIFIGVTCRDVDSLRNIHTHRLDHKENVKQFQQDNVQCQIVHAGVEHCYPRGSGIRTDVKTPPMSPEKDEESIILDSVQVSNSNEDDILPLSSTSHKVDHLLQSSLPEGPNNVMVGVNEEERQTTRTPRNSDNYVYCNVM